MAIVRFVVEVEDENDKGFNLSPAEINSVLSDMEEVIGMASYSLHDSYFERED